MRIQTSIRLTLSPETKEIWDEHENKSKLINDALEFYATHGMKIQKELEEIKHILSKLETFDFEKGGLDKPEKTKQIKPEEKKEKHITKEELELQEGISSTLAHFLGSD